MKAIDSITRLLSKVFSFKTKGKIGLSSDDKVTMDNMPASALISVGKFVEFNKELVHFEVVSVDTIRRRVRLCEICTENYLDFDFDSFEYLFHESPVPNECKF